MLIIFRGVYYDRGESSIKTRVDLNRGWGKRLVNHAPLSSLPLKQQEVLRDEMAVSLGNSEDMIANGNCLALDAIHIVGINDQRSVESYEMILWQNPLPCGKGKDRASISSDRH